MPPHLRFLFLLNFPCFFFSCYPISPWEYSVPLSGLPSPPTSACFLFYCLSDTVSLTFLLDLDATVFCKSQVQLALFIRCAVFPFLPVFPGEPTSFICPQLIRLPLLFFLGPRGGDEQGVILYVFIPPSFFPPKAFLGVLLFLNFRVLPVCHSVGFFLI